MFLFLLVSSPALAQEPLDVGVLIWSDSIPGQVAMLKGLEAEAERINTAADEVRPPVKLQVAVAGDGPKGIENQIVQMQGMVDAGVDLIIVQPTDNAALVAPLLSANQAGIPGVAYDQYISGGTLAAYLTSDNYQAGYDDGEYIAERFPNDAPLKLVVVEYPHVSSTVERLDGFLDALRAREQPFELLKSYEGVEPVGGKKAGEALLADFPAKGSVDVVFTVNDGGGLAVVDALAAAGRTEIAVASIDGDPESVKNIRDGRLTVIDSAQFCGPLGAEAMKAGYALLTGQPVLKHQLVPTFPITAETIERYPGWLGPLPVAFDKPWPSASRRWEPEMRAPAAP